MIQFLLIFAASIAITAASIICHQTGDIAFPDFGKCYSFQQKYGQGLLTFDQAIGVCSKLGKRLASFTAPSRESAFVAAEMKRLGWTKIAISPRYRQSAWKWVSDDTLLRGQGCYRVLDDEPDIHQMQEPASVIKCIESCDGKLFASLQGASFCHCPTGVEFNWPPSSSDCQSVCLSANNKNESCGGMFSRYVYATPEDVYDNWAFGRPSLGGECAAINIDHKANNWIDASCNLPLPFICKFGDNKHGTDKIPIAAERVACSPNGVCYYLYKNPAMTWFDADKFCAKYGGRLAKIESPDRQELINTMLYDLGRSNSNMKVQEQIDEQLQSPSSPLNLQAWIGATNHAWYDVADNNATIYAVYRSWQSAGQPEMPDRNACTVFTLLPNGDHGWQTANCNKTTDDGRFLCVGNAATN